MRLRTASSAICVLVAALSVATVSSATTTPRTISVLEIDTSFAPTGGFSFASHRPPRPGEGFAFGATLYKWAGAKRGAPYGHLAAMCTVVTSVQALCNGALFLPGGVLELLTPTNIENNVPQDIPIVGGTGVYVGAQGYMHTRSIGGSDSNKSSLVIHLR